MSDSDKKISKAYGVLDPSGNFAQRYTFIIAPDGKIAHIFDKVNVELHGREVKAILDILQSK